MDVQEGEFLIRLSSTTGSTNNAINQLYIDISFKTAPYQSEARPCSRKMVQWFSSVQFSPLINQVIGET